MPPSMSASRDEQARLGAVAVIADGVGGAQGGRVAAELAVRSFVDGHLGQNATLGIQRNSARTIEAFNSWAHAVGAATATSSGMATTLTALVLRGRRVHVIHVGDTRAYRWRDGALDRMTTDHAMAGAGLRHILTRAVGADESIRIDYASDTVRLYDRYLLCSDGIHGGVSRIARWRRSWRSATRPTRPRASSSPPGSRRAPATTPPRW